MRTRDIPCHAQVVHWNRPGPCIEVATRLVSIPGLEVTIIDNGSNPENLTRLRKGLPKQVAICELGANLGWGQAHNTVLAKWLECGRSEFALVSAHDTRIHEGCIELLLSAATAEPRLGVLCPQYAHPELAAYSPVRGPHVIMGKPLPAGTTQDVDLAHGTLTLYRRECLKNIGLFDKRFFAYGDEMDLSLRARAAGWRVALVWGAIVENPETSTRRDLVGYLYARNTLLLARTHGSASRALLRLLLMLCNSVRLAVSGGSDSRLAFAKARLSGARDYLLHRFGAPMLD